MNLKILILLIFLPITPERIIGKVIRILDGDTIEILYNNAPVRIRLNGIDCPEKGQDFGIKAKEFTSNSCFGAVVTVISYGEDRYGRTLGDIILPNGLILNQELVSNGLAWHYKKYSSDTVLAKLEQGAKSKHKGLWNQSNNIAPWDFRRMN